MSKDSLWEEENRRGAYLYQQGHYAEAEHAFRTALEGSVKFQANDVVMSESGARIGSLCNR
jgi:Flp pilus assembly protein TadD